MLKPVFIMLGSGWWSTIVRKDYIVTQALSGHISINPLKKSANEALLYLL